MRHSNLIHTDCRDYLPTMPSESVDLVYADPPFCTGRNFGEFDDRWGGKAETEVGSAAATFHSEAMGAYIDFMDGVVRQLHRILKPTGSIYLHCDPTASHYLKLLLDSIFGKANFRNEIVWCYTGPSSPKMKNFPRKHDTIFRYSKSKVWTWNQQRVPYKDPNQTLRKAMDGGAGLGPEVVAVYRERGKPVEDWWTKFSPVGRSKKERTGYPTQKPLALLERIIKASSNEGDVVLDPFVGCGTTCVAAERLNRQWIGIDIGDKAIEIAASRLPTTTVIVR